MGIDYWPVVSIGQWSAWTLWILVTDQSVYQQLQSVSTQQVSNTRVSRRPCNSNHGVSCVHTCVILKWTWNATSCYGSLQRFYNKKECCWELTAKVLLPSPNSWFSEGEREGQILIVHFLKEKGEGFEFDRSRLNSYCTRQQKAISNDLSKYMWHLHG